MGVYLSTVLTNDKDHHVTSGAEYDVDDVVTCKVP